MQTGLVFFFQLTYVKKSHSAMPGPFIGLSDSLWNCSFIFKKIDLLSPVIGIPPLSAVKTHMGTS